MQKLTNLRYRFNDGDLFKYMAYPEVDFTSDEKAFLFNEQFTTQKDFDNAFKTIIWVSYRKNFPALTRGPVDEVQQHTDK
jgi:hypothetical protein